MSGWSPQEVSYGCSFKTEPLWFSLPNVGKRNIPTIGVLRASINFVLHQYRKTLLRAISFWISECHVVQNSLRGSVVSGWVHVHLKHPCVCKLSTAEKSLALGKETLGPSLYSTLTWLGHQVMFFNTFLMLWLGLWLLGRKTTQVKDYPHHLVSRVCIVNITLSLQLSAWITWRS